MKPTFKNQIETKRDATVFRKFETPETKKVTGKKGVEETAKNRTVSFRPWVGWERKYLDDMGCPMENKIAII